MTNPRKIARASKKVQATTERKLEKKNARVDFTWATLSEMHTECATTIARNAEIVREVIRHEDLKDADPVDLARIATVTTKLTVELTKELVVIRGHTDGKSGPLSHNVHSSDFDTALIVFDLYDNLTASITDQYASITDALYVLRQQLIATSKGQSLVPEPVPVVNTEDTIETNTNVEEV